MATTRDELILDWRKRLSDAQESAEAARGAVWLAKVRIRLYHFLLSIYGDGDWNAPPLAVHEELNPTRGSTDCEVDSPLVGKPARKENEIRDFLKSIGGARDQVPAVGSLTAESVRKSWQLADFEGNESPCRSQANARAFILRCIAAAMCCGSFVMLFAIAIVYSAWPELNLVAPSTLLLDAAVPLGIVFFMAGIILHFMNQSAH